MAPPGHLGGRDYGAPTPTSLERPAVEHGVCGGPPAITITTVPRVGGRHGMAIAAQVPPPCSHERGPSLGCLAANQDGLAPW